MSEEGFPPRPSWDGTSTDRDRDPDVARNANGNSSGAGGTNGRMPHYAPSSESLHHHPTQQLFDEHNHGHTHAGSVAPPTPTKQSTSPHPRESVESATRPSFASGSGAGSGAGRWADGMGAGPMAGIGTSAGASGGGMATMAMAVGTQSELGHGYAPPRLSIDSELEGMGSGDDGERGPASATDMATLVEPSFDENILRALCETDVSNSFLVWLDVRTGVVFADFMLDGARSVMLCARDTPSAVCLCYWTG